MNIFITPTIFLFNNIIFKLLSQYIKNKQSETKATDFTK